MEGGLLRKAKQEDRRVFREMAWWALIGLIMLLLAYPLTFTALWRETHGRGTRVHVAAALGAVLAIAALLAELFHYAARYRVTLVVVVALSVLFGALVLSGVSVQQGYVASWRMQQQFWQAIILQAPDMDEGDAIFVVPAGLFVTGEMPVWNWSNYLIPPQIYKMPSEWKVLPRVFPLPWDWRRQLLLGRDLRKFAVPMHERDRFTNAEIILFEGEATNLKRAANPLVVEGQRFPLKGIPSEMEAPYTKGILYQYLIGE